MRQQRETEYSAHVKRLNLIRSLWHINTRINPITLFGVHVNTTFGFDNQNEFIRMEAKSVHVNIATVKAQKSIKKHRQNSPSMFYTFLGLDSVNCLAVNGTVTSLSVFITGRFFITVTVRSHRRRRERQNSLWPPCQRRCRKIRWRSDDRTLGLVFKGAEKETSMLILCRLITSRV